MTSDEGVPSPARRTRRSPGPKTKDAGTPPAGMASPTAEAGPRVAEDGTAITADHVEVRMGAVGRVDTQDLQVVQGAVGAVRASDMTVQQGAVGASLVGTATLRQSVASSIVAREARIQQSLVRTVMAAEVRFERASGVGILIARRVSGDVRVLLDWRGAAAFGAAFGLVAGLVRIGGRVRSGRRGRRG